MTTRLLGLGGGLVTLATAFGVLLGVGVYTFDYAEGLSYFSTDPAACTNCHIMQPQFDSWQKASHHGVAGCVDCHLPHDTVPKYLSKADNGYFHSKGFTFQDFHEPILVKDRNRRILEANCLRCHRPLVDELVGVAHGGRGAISCVRCHRTAGHGETVGMGRIDRDLQALKE